MAKSKKSTDNVAQTVASLSTDNLTALTALTPDAIALLPVEQQQAISALQEYAKNRLASGEKTPSKRAPLELQNLDPNATVYLSDLITLEDAFGDSGREVMRDINRDHMYQLMLSYQQGKTIEGIVIVGSNWGAIVLNGYHRWGAQEDALKLQFQTPDGKWITDGKAKYEAARTTQPVDFTPYHGVDGTPQVFEVLNYASMANLDNALNVSTNNRCRLAILYKNRMLKQGVPIEELSYGKLALQFGIKHRNAIKQMEVRDEVRLHPELKKTKRLPADLIVAPVDAEEVQQSIHEEIDRIERAPTKSAKAALQIVRAALVLVVEGFNNADDLAQFITDDYIESQKEFEALQLLGEALSMVYYEPTEEELNTQQEVTQPALEYAQE